MARKKFVPPNPDEVEALFATVDDTGHTNVMKARKQRLFRAVQGVPRVLDPLSETNPAGAAIERIIRTTALIFVFTIMMIVVVAQVSCGVARRAITANLSSNVSYETVYRALENGVEWGDGFTHFPNDFKVIEANERTHRVEVSVINDTTDNEMDCFAASNIQSTAFAVNALMNPQIDVVVFHVDIHKSSDGLPEKSRIFGLVKPTGTVKRFLTFVWSKHTTENGVNFTSSITGADPALMDKLKRQVNMPIGQSFFTGNQTYDKDLYQYKTDDIANSTRVGKIVSSTKYPQGYAYDSVAVHADKKPYSIVVYLSASEAAEAPKLQHQATIAFALIQNLQKITYVDIKSKDQLAQYTRDKISDELKQSNQTLDGIAASDEVFEKFTTAANK